MDDLGSKLIWVTQNENVFEVEDILTKILLRLPVKSLLICKSVCKYWRGLISSPSFMHLRLIQSQENPSYVFYPYIFYPYPASWDDNIRLLTKTDGETTQGFPGCDAFYFKGVICSFNGLICCINSTFCTSIRHSSLDVYISNSLDIHICNPVTRQVLLLPPTPKSDYLPAIGVSFGPRIHECKVFQFYYSECMVYSSITGSWKSIGTVAYRPYNSSSDHVCINGIVYWFSKSRIDGDLVGHILAVDREEIFSIIRIPEEETISPFLNKFGIWALQYSKESIWIKKWSDDIPYTFNIEGHNYVAVRKNEILFGSLRQYFFYNMRTRTWREFMWEHGYEVGFSCPMAYIESLLPCKYSNVNYVASPLHVWRDCS
ncbi:hypothetical protein PVL29_025586 [Vitis rotundifolia]|uniref:F-box domain-containing protein n=1 Tax=Vitis rotundifolia TaxID=103349 RepID=A0AA38YKC1_VITRO|nr:hypothetical protein PVL29_025586 [Vitis rotundifolia]